MVGTRSRRHWVWYLAAQDRRPRQLLRSLPELITVWMTAELPMLATANLTNTDGCDDAELPASLGGGLLLAPLAGYLTQL
jgi:hypothetical protein